MTALQTAILLIICAAALAVLRPQRERTNRNPPPTYPRPPAPPAPPLMRPQGAKMTKQATPREVSSHAGLGPLPKTEYTLASGFAVSRMPGYSADQMRAYAAAAVAGPDGESERAALNRAPLDDAQALALARQHLDKGLSWAPHIVRCTDLEVRALIRAVEAAHGIGA